MQGANALKSSVASQSPLSPPIFDQSQLQRNIQGQGGGNQYSSESYISPNNGYLNSITHGTHPSHMVSSPQAQQLSQNQHLATEGKVSSNRTKSLNTARGTMAFNSRNLNEQAANMSVPERETSAGDHILALNLTEDRHRSKEF